MNYRRASLNAIPCLDRRPKKTHLRHISYAKLTFKATFHMCGFKIRKIVNMYCYVLVDCPLRIHLSGKQYLVNNDEINNIMHSTNPYTAHTSSVSVKYI